MNSFLNNIFQIFVTKKIVRFRLNSIQSWRSNIALTRCLRGNVELSATSIDRAREENWQLRCGVIRYFNFRKHLAREQRIVRDKRVKIGPSSYIFLHSTTGEKMPHKHLSANSRDKF